MAAMAARVAPASAADRLTVDFPHTEHPGGPMFEDQYVDLLPARTTMQAITGTGGAGGAGGAGGPAAAVSLAVNVSTIVQTATAVSVFGGDAIATNSATTGDAIAGDATATGGDGGAGGEGGGGIG